LLTPQGTLYTLEPRTAAATPDIETEATEYLVLTARRDDTAVSQIIPATLTRGVHTSAAMAYDSDSQMLFTFWLRQVTLMQSELLFASLSADGTWSPATAFGQQFDFRENLRIAVTRKIADSETETLVPGVTVHVVWWEFDTKKGHEGAQYAMLAVENGSVAEVTHLSLNAFAASTREDTSVTDLSVIKQALIVASPKQDSVLVTFGDVEMRRFHQVRISPVRPPKSDGRLRVPVGRREGGFDAPAFAVANNARMGAIFGDTDRLAFYVPRDQTISYVVLKDGKWSPSQSILLDDHITRPAALDAIRRLVNDH
jgi:hypothetical protein